jgi:Chitobiase/beta-hexosaminidase C-terminal domain
VTTRNVTAQYNDFSGIHRIAWEEQPQRSQNVVFEYNSYHDPTNPFFGNFDLSLACCDTGATVPGVVVVDNVLIQNVPTGPSPSYIGYGIEAWGNGAKYNNNFVEGLNNAEMIAWGYGELPWEIKNNYVCSPTSKNLIREEGNWKQKPPIQTGNVTTTTCAARASSAPTISPPASGTYSAPIQVTLTDAGFTSGVGPLGNTSIYYTTDGSSPTTLSPLYTGPFSVAPGSTVKAIGMWGSGANPKSYPAGYGFVPSVVRSAHYVASDPANRR